ncbi:hypothetical protein DY000_02047849 [Brassica cretica]|uniref:Uncharacterized protein n=1 Tax=Brassica cretica TaxID=69181 RepID=A0ABQ7EXQ8_BRACR|nr:hypothetical protein DY000_02047849 [Brassica cretica]
MKAPDSFRNLGFWFYFYRDHSHKTEDCVTLKIEVNELLKKGHLKEFLFEKAKSHLSKDTTGKPIESAPVSPFMFGDQRHKPDYSEGKDQGLIAITE